ncbi:enoyl-CoA hydratase-related protein [Hydrogenophaga sp.]|uniref:enoyl-CoA hydratase-related protein n=1 Tax=Hydrogenophaga sp. TaxID=1904254 RepID=UPI00271D1A04|nr:enoyl-CoA hydratase-related protein [Hydrogenophaga sp.]MDO9439055.1 enoyl-CoA hydratase-related protein [Hydrogenophaga sp.]
MAYSDYQTLSFRMEGDVLLMSFNRPQAMNAFNQAMHSEFARVFAEIALDERVRAVVLTGEGRAFSAGGDLDMVKNLDRPTLDRIMVEARKIILDMLALPQPIIAAVNGAAAGLGATIALFCDVVYAAEQAKISDPHVRIGVTAGDGGAVIWPMLVGVSRAKEYLLSGDSVTAVEAERIGLVNHAVPADQVVAQALAYATRLAQGSQIAIRSTKRAVNKVLEQNVNLVLDLSLQLEKECFSDPFHKQAVEAISAQIGNKTKAARV